MTQPPLNAFAGRSKSASRKARPARMRLALGSSCQPPCSSNECNASWCSAESSGVVFMMRCAFVTSGETAQANSRTVSSPAGACSCGRNPIVAAFSSETLPSSGDASPRMSEKSVDFPAPFGPTKPTRSPRFTWSDASSKRMRPAKAFETWEIVSMRAAANVANPSRDARVQGVSASTSIANAGKDHAPRHSNSETQIQSHPE